jgi:hypothetical protein
LVSLVLYGGLARGEYAQARSKAFSALLAFLKEGRRRSKETLKVS